MSDEQTFILIMAPVLALWFGCIYLLLRFASTPSTPSPKEPEEKAMTMPSDDLTDAIRFHGHFGPFLVLGLRAGVIGINFLGKAPFALRATIETSLHPPRSCFIDGIQFASGCTIGKHTLEVQAGDTVSVEFIRGERRIRLLVRDGILQQLDHVRSENEEEISEQLLTKRDEELFLIEREGVS